MIKTTYNKLRSGLGIRRKLILIFLLVGLLPLIIVSAISIPYFSKVLTDAIGNSFEHIATQMRDKLDAILRMEIEESKRYGIAGGTIREETKKANVRYSNTNDTEIVETLKQRDTLWAATTADDMWVKQYLENTLAQRLKLYQQSHPREYVEIIVTDSKGALIGGTRKTSHYYQGKESWWINAFHGNPGAIYVSSIHLDESSDIYVLDIAAPIMDDSQHSTIGVIKVTLNAAEVFKTILDLKIGETGHAHLVDSSGKILIEGAKDNTACAFITGEILDANDFKKNFRC